MPDKRGGAKFCSPECKNAYHNKLRPVQPSNGRLSGLSLKATVPVIKKSLSIEKPISTAVEKSTSAKLIPFSPAEPLVFSNAIYSNSQEPVKEVTFSEPPVVLPPAFLVQVKTVANPVYTDLQQKMAVLNQQKAATSKVIREIQSRMEEVKAGNGREHIILGAGIGSFLGYQFGKARSKTSQRGSATWAVLLGLAGALIGNGTRSASEKNREQKKNQELSVLNTQLTETMKVAKAIQKEHDKLGLQLFGLPETVDNRVQLPNPAYAVALKKQQEQKDRLAKAPRPDKIYPAGQDPHETERILSAANMSQLNTMLLNFQGAWLQLIGQPQTNFKMLVQGESGSGKSHFAIQLAQYLTGFGRVLYVSGEEGFAATFQDKIRTMGAHRHPNFYTGDFRTGTELLVEAPNLYHFIVIDSINDMGISYEQYLQIIERFRQSGIIALFQNTKSGKFRGSNEFIHKSDIALKLEKGLATTIKNRYKATGEILDVMKIYKDSSD